MKNNHAELITPFPLSILQNKVISLWLIRIDSTNSSSLSEYSTLVRQLDKLFCAFDHLSSSNYAEWRHPVNAESLGGTITE
jgi:hypothetical protein